ncbi:MAG: choline/carnitine O-acyltransferase [Thermoleophilaceae bacterium]
MEHGGRRALTGAGVAGLDGSEDVIATTFANEERLPPVPLPTLEESCEIFVEWCAPLLTADELATTKVAVASLLQPNSPAHKLQAALAEYMARDGVNSWLDSFWSDRYLGRRDPIALNANYFFLFTDSDQAQVERAAGLVAAAVSHKLLLDAQRIPPIVQHGGALSMEQFRFLFSTTRIPGRLRDTVRKPYSRDWPGPSRARHIAVFFRGHIFRMDVIGVDGRPHTVDELAAGLNALKADPMTGDASRAPIGQLTTKPRARWAQSRRALLDRHPRNTKALDAIETALFCLCLEEAAPRDAREACEQLLHGDGGNRWFDKAVSLIVFQNGSAGINVEHSSLDGMTISSFVDMLFARSAEEPLRESRAKPRGVPAFEAIEFEIDAELEADVRAAAASFAAAAADTATMVLSFEDFGQARAKKLGISPDAFTQMAFQLAHKRAKGFVGATYESIATRHFRHGRTEAMRVVTPEVLRFVKAVEDAEADDAARRAAFRAAAEKHVERTERCQAGYAPEQHLWELRLIKRRSGAALGAPEPLALYESPGWLKMRDDHLSTSSTACLNARYCGFGPTGNRCIGISYMLRPYRFDLHLSTPRPVADEMHLFADELRKAISELEALLAGERRADQSHGRPPVVKRSS